MTYNLKYFDIPALGEPIRLLLALGGFEFTDERIPHDAWPAIKPTTKWGQMPVLMTPDGVEMTQVQAIVHFLAKQVSVGGSKLYPEDALVGFKIDEFIFAFEDIRLKLVPTFQIKDQAEKEAARAKLFAEDGECAALLGKLNGFSGEKFMVGDATTLADVWCFYFLNFLRCGFWDGLPTNFLATYPNLEAVVAGVGAIPKVKEYYTKQAAEAGDKYKVFAQ